MELEKEIKHLKDSGKIKPDRWKKLKAWLKLAKDRRLFSILDMVGFFLEFQLREMFNCPFGFPLEECMKNPCVGQEI